MCIKKLVDQCKSTGMCKQNDAFQMIVTFVHLNWILILLVHMIHMNVLQVIGTSVAVLHVFTEC